MKRTPLRRKSPIKSRPARNLPEKPTSARKGGKRTPRPSEDEKRFHAHLRGLGCFHCGGPAQIHHVTSDGFKRVARSHRLVVPICPPLHQHDHGKHSVERLGHAGFTAYWGVNLYTLALKLWGEWEALAGCKPGISSLT